MSVARGRRHGVNPACRTSAARPVTPAATGARCAGTRSTRTRCAGMRPARSRCAGTRPTRAWCAHVRPTRSRPTEMVVRARRRTVHMGSAVIPAVPAGVAAPAQPAAEGIAAPVEAGAVPAVGIEAIVAAAENELGLFDVRRCDEAAVNRECLSGRDGTERPERQGCSCCINPLTHGSSFRRTIPTLPILRG